MKAQQLFQSPMQLWLKLYVNLGKTLVFEEGLGLLTRTPDGLVSQALSSLLRCSGEGVSGRWQPLPARHTLNPNPILNPKP